MDRLPPTPKEKQKRLGPLPPGRGARAFAAVRKLAKKIYYSQKAKRIRHAIRTGVPYYGGVLPAFFARKLLAGAVKLIQRAVRPPTEEELDGPKTLQRRPGPSRLRKIYKFFRPERRGVSTDYGTLSTRRVVLGVGIGTLAAIFLGEALKVKEKLPGVFDFSQEARRVYGTRRTRGPRLPRDVPYKSMRNPPEKYAEAVDIYEGRGYNPKSGAQYKYQFIPATWIGLVNEYLRDNPDSDKAKQLVQETENYRRNNPQAGLLDILKFQAKVKLSWRANEDEFKELMFANFTKKNAYVLIEALGREPEERELYLAHQQGAGGAVALLLNKNRTAFDVLREHHSDKIALACIMNNLGTFETHGMNDAQKEEFAKKLTAGEFAEAKMKHYDKIRNVRNPPKPKLGEPHPVPPPEPDITPELEDPNAGVPDQGADPALADPDPDSDEPQPVDPAPPAGTQTPAPGAPAPPRPAPATPAVPGGNTTPPPRRVGPVPQGPLI